MKHFSLILFFVFSIACLEVTAQKKSGKKKFKASKVCINEVYLYKEDDKFNYRNDWHILEWIEIFNGTSKTIYLKDLFLTDDPANLTKWSISPRNRKLILLKKKKFFPVYFHDRSRRNGSILKDYEPQGNLFLTMKENDTIVILDTFQFSSQIKYPYSRYPDGGDFRTTDWLTPGAENLLIRESGSRNTYGASIQIGRSNSTSPEFQNSSYPKLAGGAGIYSRKNFGFYSLEYGLRVGMRGFRIDYSVIDSTTYSKGINNIHSKGKQTVYYLDIPYLASTPIFKNLSIFGGPMLSVKIKSFLSYTAETTFTFYDNTKPPTHKVTKYRSSAGNLALDLIEFSALLGIRYEWPKVGNFTVYYARDLSGLNIGSGNVLATQTNKGLYFSVEKPFFLGKKRVKRKSIF
jgi:hypothetical protein